MYRVSTRHPSLAGSQRELFITADLFEDKNWKAVLKNVHGLSRHCHSGVEGFNGPHIGIKKKKVDSKSKGLWATVGTVAKATTATKARAESTAKKKEPDTADETSAAASMVTTSL